MAKIKLNDGGVETFKHLFFCLQLLSYALFPNNESQRKGWIASWGGYGRSQLLSSTAQDMERDLEEQQGKKVKIPHKAFNHNIRILADEITGGYFDSFGGVESVQTLPALQRLEKQVQNQMWEIVKVGIMYRLVGDLSKHFEKPISITQVIPIYLKHDFFYDLHNGKIHLEDQTVLKLWRKYAKVRHICATISRIFIDDYNDCKHWKMNGIPLWSNEHRDIALRYFFTEFQVPFKLRFVADYPDYTGLGIGINQLLVYVMSYQNYGLHYKMKQRKEHLLDRRAWLLPNNVMCIENIHKRPSKIFLSISSKLLKIN
jgi:hypothetical protein